MGVGGDGWACEKNYHSALTSVLTLLNAPALLVCTVAQTAVDFRERETDRGRVRQKEREIERERERNPDV